eukprot:TRINITY_DN5911_c0_g2_i2.p1 TRINITY_DN5911_c0_g2~~TRINITY_DN5911_c0_g2_i2.p1  ORF type:complete len:431 (+),score=105.20 TRINITY_DN5911_c0_g2_i2:206-1498(+)
MAVSDGGDERPLKAPPPGAEVSSSLQTLDALLDAAVRAVAFASRVSIDVQSRIDMLGDNKNASKSDKTPVTIADYAVQCMITEFLSTVTGAGASLRLMAEEDAELFQDQGQEGILQEVANVLNAFYPFEEVAAVSDKAKRGPFSLQDVLALLRLGCDKGGRDGSFWVLDPIDGTKGFLRNQHYAIGLAFLCDGQPLLGAVCCPNLAPFGKNIENKAEGSGVGFVGMAVRPAGNAAWSGSIPLSDCMRLSSCESGREKNVPGIFDKLFGNAQGAAPLPHLGGIPWRLVAERLQGSTLSSLPEATLCESYESGHRDGDGIRPRSEKLAPLKLVRLDSFTKYFLVGRGDAHVYLRGNPAKDVKRPEKIWDHAAAYLLVLGAGGKVTDLRGRPLDFGCGRELLANKGVLATNGVLHEEVLEEIRKVCPEDSAVA